MSFLSDLTTHMTQMTDQGITYLLQGGSMSNGNQVVMSGSDLTLRLKEGSTQVVHVPANSFTQVDWASKLKVAHHCSIAF